MDMRTLFVCGKSEISLLQFSSNPTNSLFWRANWTFCRCQSWINVMFGVRMASLPRVPGPPWRHDGIPAQTRSPQIKNTTLGRTQGFWEDLDGVIAVQGVNYCSVQIPTQQSANNKDNKLLSLPESYSEQVVGQKMLMSTLVLHNSRKETGLFMHTLASTLWAETKKKFAEHAVLTKTTPL